jgi:hypothetical protein
MPGASEAALRLPFSVRILRFVGRMSLRGFELKEGLHE